MNRLVEPETAPEVAVMVILPKATLVAKPPALIVAAAVLLELHVTEFVMFTVVLSAKVPVAVNCKAVPAKTVGFTGVTTIETSGEEVTVRVAVAVKLP